MKKSHFFVTLLLLHTVIASASTRTLIPEESSISFTVKEMGVPVTGEFKHFRATINIDNAKIENSSASLGIDVGSLSTGNEEADAIAVNADWLDKVRAPEAIFKSLAIRRTTSGRYEANAKLTIRNIQRDFLVEFVSTEQANGKTLITSDFVIHRVDFGIGGGVWNEEGVVAKEIPVKIRLMLAPAAR